MFLAVNKKKDERLACKSEQFVANHSVKVALISFNIIHDYW